MPRVTAMEAYKLLPKTNCKKCEEPSCMSFALKLVARETTLSKCPQITKENNVKLTEYLTPPVREVAFGKPEQKIGGEEVMYRHDLRFFNPCAIAIDVSDTMPNEEITRRVDFVKKYEIERVGEKLRLNAIAVRCASNNPQKFAEAVKKVSEQFQGPMILCSLNADALAAGAEAANGQKPLLYAATSGNWRHVVEVAKKHKTPVVAYASNLSELGTLTANISAEGVDEIIIDPGLETIGKGFTETLDKLTMIRRSAIKNVSELRYPIMAAPAAVHIGAQDNITASYYEALIGSILLDRYASLLVLHSTEPWVVLPLVTLRQNIYTDPRTEPKVEAKLYEVGKPNENSPVILTTNFSLTYYTVAGDIERANISCWLLVIETNGFAVDTAVATGDLNASKIKEAMEKSKLAEKVKHKKIIIPLLALHIRNSVEDETGWEVLTGPRDSSQIGKFLEEHWKS